MDKVGEDNIPSTTVYNTIPSNDTHTNCIAIVYQVGEGTVYIIDILALTLSPLLSVYPPPPHSSLEICCENVNTWRLKYPEQIGAYTFSTSSIVWWETHRQVLFLMSEFLQMITLKLGVADWGRGLITNIMKLKVSTYPWENSRATQILTIIFL